MNNRFIIKSLTIIILCFLIKPSAWGQVDDTQPTSDTLYIYDEEVIYDTLYIQSTPLEELLTKEDLLEAFQKSGIGQIYYKKGHFWLTGNDDVYKLDNSDLQMLFTPAQYELYQHPSLCVGWRRGRRSRPRPRAVRFLLGDDGASGKSLEFQ